MLFKTSIISSLLLAGASASAIPERRTTNTYLTNAHTAITKLQSFYNDPSPGFWSAGWWNSANCLTLLADLRQKDSSAFITAITDGKSGVFQHTLNSQHRSSTGALSYDEFFDDELWWVIALIKTYDVTKNGTFLYTAKESFNAVTLNDLTSNNPCGGLANAYPSEEYLVKSSTIATLLYVEAAAQLAYRYPSSKTTYLNLAKTQWEWIAENILIDGILQGDSLTGSPPSCANNHAFLTYIEGVALSALTSLYYATNNATYLTTANTIATEVLSGKYGMVSSTGIVTEYCDAAATCTPDTAQFKGILMRGLRSLYVAKPSAVSGKIPAFIKANADSIWANTRRTSDNLLGQKWAGPFALGSSTALQLSSHSSATMALVMAALMP